MKDKNYGKKRLGKSCKQTTHEILDTEHNPYSVHPSNIMDMKQNEAIIFLAEQLDTLGAIVKAYKTGKL